MWRPLPSRCLTPLRANPSWRRFPTGVRELLRLLLCSECPGTQFFTGRCYSRSILVKERHPPSRGWKTVTKGGTILHPLPPFPPSGVALAWPLDKYEAITVDIARVSETRKWGREPREGGDQKQAPTPAKEERGGPLGLLMRLTGRGTKRPRETNGATVKTRDMEPEDPWRVRICLLVALSTALLARYPRLASRVRRAVVVSPLV